MGKRVAIIQARMSSARLPGKVLKRILGKEMLGHVLDRVFSCDALDGIVVATTEDPKDERIVEFVKKYGRGAECFRGSEDNVLDRYYRAAVTFGADWIVRITSDSPLLDPSVIRSVITTTIAGDYDYGSNSLIPTMPDGLDVECMKLSALELAWKEASLPHELEHVTPYIRMNPKLFRMANLFYARDLSSLCWAVDSGPDFRFISTLAEHINLLDPSNYSFERIMAVLERYQHLQNINSVSIRDCKLLEKIPNIFRHDTSEFASYFFNRENGET